MKRICICLRNIILTAMFVSLASCAGGGGIDKYRDPNMDFGSIQNVAVLPFVNLSRDQQAGDRVRDVFVTALLATGGIYVIPTGEVSRGIGLAGMANAGAPSTAEIKKLAPLVKADAIISGVVREYGEVRAGSSVANVISVSLQMAEVQSGRVVWSATSTKGGIGLKDRLLGGGGEPLNKITEEAIRDLINQLYE
jgi:polysaccharide biosynthesis protein PelC